MEEPKLYEPRYRQVMAVQFDGTYRHADMVVMPLITRSGMSPVWDPEERYIRVHGFGAATDSVHEGDYVVRSAIGGVSFMSESEFNDRYQPVKLREHEIEGC